MYHACDFSRWKNFNLIIQHGNVGISTDFFFVFRFCVKKNVLQPFDNFVSTYMHLKMKKATVGNVTAIVIL